MAKQTNEYYKKIWGWDPEKIKVWNPEMFTWEEWYPLQNDPALHAAGIEIGARVIVLLHRSFTAPWEVFRNFMTRIVFRKFEREGQVHCLDSNGISDDLPCHEHGIRRMFVHPDGTDADRGGLLRPECRVCRCFKQDPPKYEEREVGCIHVAVTTTTLEQLPEFQTETAGSPSLDLNLEKVSSTSGEILELAPEEHFVALRSFVAGIAEMGLETMFSTKYSTDALFLPFGFNSLLQRQVMECLITLCPIAAKSIQQRILGDLLETAPLEWLLSHLELLVDTYQISSGVLDDSFLKSLPETARAKLKGWAVYTVNVFVHNDEDHHLTGRGTQIMR